MVVEGAQGSTKMSDFLNEEAARLIALDNYTKGVDNFADFLDLAHGSWKEGRFKKFVRKFHEYEVWKENDARRAKEGSR
jgi:hypothetical protein